MGGPPFVATRLAAAQRRLGHEVTLLCHEEPRARERIEQLLASMPPGVQRVAAPPATGLEKVLALRSRAPVARAIESAEAAHLHGMWEGMVYWAASTAARRHIPYCITPHGMLDPWCLNRGALKKRLVLAVTMRGALERASFIHALNADEAALLRPLRLSAPVEVVPNGVFLDEVDPLPTPGDFRRRHAALGADPFVLFLGRLDAKKGLDLLVDAFKLVLARRPETRLVIAGPDYGALAPTTDHAARIGVADRLHGVGPLYGRDKFAAMIDASLFCLPSRQEGFSMAVVEAMACGRPVVISRECHFPEVAGRDAGLIAPLEAAGLAHALTALLENPPRAQRMGAAGRALIAERYTWPSIARRLVEAYQKHAAAPGAAPVAGGAP
jgi:glycosyltransferase involved in cell wall biosynthesis